MLTLKHLEDNISEIIPGKLYLGDRIAARTAPLLIIKQSDGTEIKITHVLNATLELPCYYRRRFAIKKCSERILYKQYRMIDIGLFPIIAYLNSAANYIHKSMDSGVVLVHCFAGMSRSASCVMAYLIKYKGMTVESAYNFVKGKRWKVRPNSGFMRQLHMFARRHRPKPIIGNPKTENQISENEATENQNSGIENPEIKIEFVENSGNKNLGNASEQNENLENGSETIVSPKSFEIIDLQKMDEIIENCNHQ
jgi:hypothetical protein